MNVNLGTIAGSSGIPFAGQIGSIITNILKGQDPDTHWEGWEKLDQQIGAPLGTNAQNWVINNGDNPRSEALNILRWIQKYGINTVVNYSTWFKRSITINDIANKFRSVGMVNEANQLLASQPVAGLSSIFNIGRTVSAALGNNQQYNSSQPLLPQDNYGNNSKLGNIQAALFPYTKYIILGVAAIVGFFIFKKSKK